RAAGYRSSVCPLREARPSAAGALREVSAGTSSDRHGGALMEFAKRVRILPIGGLVVLLVVLTAAVVLPQGGSLAPDAVGRRMPVVPRVQMARWSATSSGPPALGTVLPAYGLPFSAARVE